MKTLILIRHAKSSWKDPTLPDLKRPLNKRGKKNAPEMGKRMFKRRMIPDLFVSSPAKRAMVTAKTLAEEVGYRVSSIEMEDKIYEGGVTELLEVIWSLEDKFSKVALVGHNPGFTELSNYLAEAGIENVPTCGIVEMEFEVASWRDIGTDPGKLIHFDFPKKEEDLDGD